MKPRQSKADRQVIHDEAVAEGAYQTEVKRQAALDRDLALRAIGDRESARQAVLDAAADAEKAESAEAARHTFRSRMMRWLGLDD